MSNQVNMLPHAFPKDSSTNSLAMSSEWTVETNGVLVQGAISREKQDN
jgi:hypothetical protein